MLIVSRTPLRISFFGGGTDYPEYFTRARGAVVGMAIDKNQPAFLQWARAVEKEIEPQLRKDEERVVETMK